MSRISFCHKLILITNLPSIPIARFAPFPQVWEPLVVSVFLFFYLPGLALGCRLSGPGFTGIGADGRLSMDNAGEWFTKTGWSTLLVRRLHVTT